MHRRSNEQMKLPMRALGGHGCLLEPGPWDAAAVARITQAHEFCIWPLAVEEKGKRTEHQSVVSPQSAALIAESFTAGRPLIPLLDHAGPAAFAWMKERAYGPSDRWVHPTGRRPLGLTRELWEGRVEAYINASETLLRAGVQTAIVGMHHDGLLAAALSPVMNPDATEPERFLEPLNIFRKLQDRWASLGVCFALEEVCPGGRDPTEGISFAQCLEQEGAHGLWLAGGTALFPPGYARFTNLSGDSGDLWLTTAQWVCGHVKIPLWAVGKTHDPQVALARATKRGLRGITVTVAGAQEVKT